MHSCTQSPPAKQSLARLNMLHIHKSLKILFWKAGNCFDLFRVVWVFGTKSFVQITMTSPSPESTWWDILMVLVELGARLNPGRVCVANEFLHFLNNYRKLISDCLPFKARQVFMICYLCRNICTKWGKILSKSISLERGVAIGPWSLPKGGQSNWPICQACIELERSIPQLHRILAIHLKACHYWRHKFHKLPMSKTISSTK